MLAGNPFFGPEGWRAWPAPSVTGLAPGHTGADLADAARLGTCLAFSQILDQLAGPLPVRADTVIATGGMSRSAGWSQSLADATGRTVLVPGLDRVSGLAGAALVAGVSVESALRDSEPAGTTRTRPERRPAAPGRELLPPVLRRPGPVRGKPAVTKWGGRPCGPSLVAR